MSKLEKALVRAFQKSLKGLAYYDVDEFRTLPQECDFDKLFEYMSDDALEELMSKLKTEEVHDEEHNGFMIL